MTSSAEASTVKCLALSGGVGGAKLALGLAGITENLMVVANPGDDFEHLGLTICPDLDTVTYSLAGLANTETGWGRADETWSFMAVLEALGGESWFGLGDKDLALHVERTRRLGEGEPLSAITRDLCTRLGISAKIEPACDAPVRTIVETRDGPLPFQRYFVRDKCEPKVTGFRFEGADQAIPNAAVLAALAGSGLEAIVICPSNPFISIDPILAVLGEALRAASAPIIAVSPIIGGQAVKGPAAKMMAELGLEVSATSVARNYEGLIDGFVLDQTDEVLASEIEALGLAVLPAQTMMNNLLDKEKLAREIMEFAQGLT